MNILLENSYAWTGSFVEAFSNLVYDVANLICESLGVVTSNTSESNSENPTTSTTDTQSTSDTASEQVTGSEKNVTNISEVFQGILNWLEFDDFQFFLLKIFICILIGNICLIYIAWYIYGARISWLMSEDIEPEKFKENAEKFKFPKSYSPRL